MNFRFFTYVSLTLQICRTNYLSDLHISVFDRSKICGLHMGSGILLLAEYYDQLRIIINLRACIIDFIAYIIPLSFVVLSFSLDVRLRTAELKVTLFSCPSNRTSMLPSLSTPSTTPTSPRH